jgi:hypothetical protein
MVTSLELVTLAFVLLLGSVSFVLLWIRTPRGARLGATIDRWGRRLSDRGDWSWLRWELILLVCAAAYASVIGFDLAYGLYGCSGHGPSDILGLVASGQAFLRGTDPFSVTNCGGTILVPYGFAVLGLDGIGSLGGAAGVAAVWGAVALAVVPLTWALAGPDRRYVTAVVATSLLFLPLVSAQIDGATNALVPAAVLLVAYLAARHEPLAAAVGGFLATGRFPALFPIAAGAGRLRRAVLGVVVAVGVFGGLTAVGYAVWGNAFLGPVFFEQLNRRSFSLNVFGLFGHQGWLPGGDGLAVGQAVLTVALVLIVWWRSRSVLGAMAITLAGVALLTQFLSFNILVSLVPVALLGARPRWWLWGIAVVGTANYDLAYPYLGQQAGVWWPYELLGIVLTGLLVGLFVDLWRGELAAGRGAPTAS